MAGSETLIDIRQLYHLDEFQDVLRLQKTIWGFDDIELLPLRFLVVVSKVGGHVFGAYDGPEMIGFCFAIPGVKIGGRPDSPGDCRPYSPGDCRAYLHSHMLGVLPRYHNAGIGRRLKLTQRDEALSRGVTLMEWTFDPLELKNAFFNVERLGAIVRRYSENQYGVTASPLHGGLPTDRCVAEWHLDSDRVKRVLAGESVPHSAAAERIPYPADIARIRAEDQHCAREIQRTNGAKFLDAFSRGLAVTGFDRSDAHGTYLLEPYQE